MTDDEASLLVKETIGVIEIAQVKSLPKERRDTILRKVKHIDGMSQRQAGRIIGV